MPTLTVENVGPVPKFSFALKEYGITVLSAPCGAGKSILLDATAKLAGGCGRIPLKDGTKRGSIEGFGARMSIAGTCRHTGEFEVTNLEGRFDLADLVDPGLDKPEAADRKRIRALVTLTGAKPDVSLFSGHKAFGGKEAFDKVVQQSSLAKDDLVEMAEAIKRDYEAAARNSEDDAKRELGAARGLEEAVEAVDLTSETDEERLRLAYDAARDRRSRLANQAEVARAHAASQAEAQQRLAAAAQAYTGPDSAAAKAHLEQSKVVVEQFRKQVAEFRDLLSQAEQGLKDAQAHERQATDRWTAAESYERLVKSCGEIIGSAGPAAPTEAELAQAEQDVLTAKKRSDYGVLVRDAREKQQKAAGHREKHTAAAALADRLREAAGSIDEVLSSAIKSAVLRVESLDGKARLVVDHPVRGKTAYHELSHGEKWRVAIDLAADMVGEGGLLVLPQPAWEGLDAFLRPEIHEHAKARKVYVLAAEATRDPADGRAMQAKPFEENATNAAI